MSSSFPPSLLTKCFNSNVVARFIQSKRCLTQLCQAAAVLPSQGSLMQVVKVVGLMLSGGDIDGGPLGIGIISPYSAQV